MNEFTKVERLSIYKTIDSANFGAILLLPDTPAVIDFGENDGVVAISDSMT